MDRLVAYSLVLPRSQPRPDLLRQLVMSVESLRRYNRSIPIAVFTFDDGDEDVAPLLAAYDVRVVPQGSYEERLARLCPEGWPYLAQYPVLHKFFNFAAIAEMQPRQLLFLDCDTVFFADVALLFARHGDAHCYAREEPQSSRSHIGYDREYLDEAALAELAKGLGARPLPPFNLGVVLFNHGIWKELAELEPVAIAYAWRLLLGLAVNRPEDSPANYFELAAATALQDDPRLAEYAERTPPLRFPSRNEWILEQIAVWLALGHLRELRTADFSSDHVVQNGELFTSETVRPEWIVCHYFTQFLSRVEEWLRDSGTR